MSEAIARPVTDVLATAEAATVKLVAATAVTARIALKPAATPVPRASDAPQQKVLSLATYFD
jgi:hypothetical protein